MEDTPATQENVTTYTIHKLTYSDGRAYRYHVSDDADQLHYVAVRTGMLLPSPTRLVEFFDPQDTPTGRLQPPDVAPWLRGTRYEIFAGEETEEPYAVIQERWGLVDILLLRLPRYEVQLGQHRYIVRGSRYGAHFYRIFRPCQKGETKEELEAEETEETREVEEEPVKEDAGKDDAGGKQKTKLKEVEVGQIQHPTAGPSYVIETDAAPLRQALLVLASLVIIIDMELFS